MTSLESIEKLRTIARNMAKSLNLENHEECNLLLIAADEIEREIAEKYIELPVDADGEPIHVGDVLEYDYGDDVRGTRMVCALIYDGTRTKEFDGGIWDFEFDDDDGGDSRSVNCMSDFYKCNRHTKPRTVEDVLRDFLDEKVYTSKTYERYADEIRELMGGGR